MIIDEEIRDELIHYGTPRHSGRYPWGSHEASDEENQTHRNPTLLDRIDELKKKGLKEAEIVKGLGFESTTQLRAQRSIAISEQKQSQISQAQRLKDKGVSTSEIGRKMNAPESTVRSWLEPGAKDRATVLTKTSDMLKEQVDKKHFVDVGTGVEAQLGVSKEKLAASVAILKEKGYVVHPVKVPQLGTNFDTTHKVLTLPGTTWGEAQKNKYNIQQITEFSEDGGRSYAKIHNPISINPSRVKVNYKETGGDQADGVIYVRPGVKDVSIGGSKYAQVRVQVGKGHYLKGMAVYKNDLPAGTDLVFNTNKSDTGNMFDAMKKVSDDKDLPFQSITRQILENPGTPKERVTSAMNIVSSSATATKGSEEGGLVTWSKGLSSQFLSKQSPTLAKTQLDKTFEHRQKSFDEINKLSNPTVKKKLLESFADDSDSAAVNLEAAALSTRQAWHFILPLNSLKPDEIYAPNYNNGERVVLIRYPHGGTFELPELTVNNKHPEGRKVLGDVPDAVGIHHTVAQRLSGADFDGDTVIVIPNKSKKIKITPALEGLKDFDTMIYKLPDDSPIPRMTASIKQQQMGNVSNLITDMTIRAAPPSDIVRAIRHSMVVIDAEKHGLNYKQSAIDNGINQLKRTYQHNPKEPTRRGASTLLSRAGSEVRIPDRKIRPAAQGGAVDPVTGRKVYVDTGRTRRGKSGEPEPIMVKSKRLAETNDAHELSSGTIMEKIYADHANRLKSLANTARLTALKTPNLKYSPSAKTVYSKEVESLNSKLTLSIKNRPFERQARVIAGSQVKAKREANPNLDGDTLRKVQYQALEEARNRIGANKKETQVHITSDEWDAIQAGAISDNMLQEILKNTDIDAIRKFATPRKQHLMTDSKTSRAKSMLDSGYTRAEVAKFFDVSLSTLDLATKGELNG